ncbi:putative Ig domain-containing protein [Ottowia thiooxydans]|uniref:putative Ig domain-containing protein n=1 Tax=Ottowia thiooxydans TaxID=219182 RepID=UPI0012EB729B|nr:putative Ig domain-containing protein [Ottowia thiooxydans]
MPRFPLSLSLACIWLPVAAGAATVTVTDAGDAPLGGAVHCNTGSSTCTLRAAIDHAQPGDTIAFDFGGVPTIISPATPLPFITYPVTIDGYTNGGTPNSAATGTNAVITVRIDGANAGANAVGLQLVRGTSGSVVRGLAVTRFGNTGVWVTSQQLNDVYSVQVLGNFIGTDGSGSADDVAGLLANGRGVGVANRAQGTSVGNGTPAGRNLIVASDGGISILATDKVLGTSIHDNLIGTDRSGNQLRGGAPIGIQVMGSNSVSIRSNVIGARETGIDIVNESDANEIRSNRIGVGADGSASIGGSGHGVLIRNWMNINKSFPWNNRVGGTSAGEGNAIAHWGGNGIRVEHNLLQVRNPQGNNWRGNSIYSNGALGIELIDPGNPLVVGADPAQPQPIWAEELPMIASATGSAAGTQIHTTLMDSLRPSANFRVEAFASTACNVSGYGEGQAFLGAANIQTFASGGWAGALSFSALPTGYTHVALTATWIGVNGFAASSEFSRCVAVQIQGGGSDAPTPPAVASGSASALVNQPFSHALAQYVTATDGDSLQSYALLGTLPPGLGFDSATGLLTGTPGTPGIYPLLLSASDKDGTASAVFTLTVTGPGGDVGGGGGGASPTAIPTLGTWGWLLLSGLLGGFVPWRKRLRN